MSGYTKLFGSLIHSTIWREPDHIRIVWITMLAMSDQDDIVEASLPGLADAARVSMEQCQEALECLLAPDPYSRSVEHEGRRIETVDGGWRVLNRAKYRQRMSREDRRAKDRERKKRVRAASASVRKRPPASADVRKVPQVEVEVEVDTDQILDPQTSTQAPAAPSSQAAARPSDVRQVYDHWVQSTQRSPKRTKLDAKRRKRIQARLREGHSVADLCLAIDHRVHDPWLMGLGDSPRVYDDLHTLLRDNAQVERLRDLVRPLPVPQRRGFETPAQREQREAAEYKGVSKERWLSDD